MPLLGDLDGDGRPDNDTPQLTPPPDLRLPIDPGPEEAPPTDDAASALAEKMTMMAVDRCEHGRANRCWLCGVERVRDFDVVDGVTQWHVAWRPIAAMEAA